MAKRFRAKILGAFESPLDLYSSVESTKQITEQLKISQFTGKKNEYRVLYSEQVVGVVGLGKKETLNADIVRNAASSAIKNIRNLNRKEPLLVQMDDFGHPFAAAEGSVLGTFEYDSFKKEKVADCEITPVQVTNQWKEGLVLGHAQNMARYIMETPANHMNPRIFADFAQQKFKDLKNVQVIVRDQEWVQQQKMGAFLSVSNGSVEPLKFIEIHYRGGTGKPVALVGKGVTFDSGGISIKPSSGMALMKGDLGGAACVLSTMWAIAQLQIPQNVSCFIPLTENMPSGSATKPGDVVVARNGLSIEVDNTDAEGRLILADAIDYACTFDPCAVVELSTLTGAMDVALGSVYAGVFSNSDTLWTQLNEAGKKAGDRFWRMPLDDQYHDQIKSTVADLKNVGDRSAGSCTAAIFLKQFVKKDIDFAHIDIAGVMHSGKPSALLSSGMSGRPTRSIIEYCRSL